MTDSSPGAFQLLDTALGGPFGLIHGTVGVGQHVLTVLPFVHGHLHASASVSLCCRSEHSAEIPRSKMSRELLKPSQRGSSHIKGHRKKRMRCCVTQSLAHPLMAAYRQGCIEMPETHRTRVPLSPAPPPPSLLLFQRMIQSRDCQCDLLEKNSFWPSLAKFPRHLLRKFFHWPFRPETIGGGGFFLGPLPPSPSKAAPLPSLLSSNTPLPTRHRMSAVNLQGCLPKGGAAVA